MGLLRIELPEELRAEMADRLTRRGVTESAWVEEAVREKLATDVELEALEVRAARGKRPAFEQILAKVPDAVPDTGDERQ